MAERGGWAGMEARPHGPELTGTRGGRLPRLPSDTMITIAAFFPIIHHRAYARISGSGLNRTRLYLPPARASRALIFREMALTMAATIFLPSSGDAFSG